MTAAGVYPTYTGPERRKGRVGNDEDHKEAIAAAALNLLSSMTVQDLITVQQAHQTVTQPRITLTAEERRKRKNEAQRLARSTPEGKAYANEASKKSIANKKRVEAIKALLKERIEAQLTMKKVTTK